MTKKFVTSQLRVGQLIYYILEEKTFGSQKIIQQNAKKLLKTTMSHKYLLLILNVRCTHLAKNDYCFDIQLDGICCRPEGPTPAGFKGWAKVDPNAAAEESDRKAVPDRLFEVDVRHNVLKTLKIVH